MSNPLSLPNLAVPWAGLVLALAFCSLASSPVRGQNPSLFSAPPAPGGEPTEILGLQLRTVQGELRLLFLLSGDTQVEVVENFPRRVMVVKFLRARATLSGGQTDFVFNHPLLEGVAFEQVNGASWAKLRFRTPDLAFRLVRPPEAGRVVVGLRAVPPGAAVALTGVRLGRAEGGSRVVLDLSALAEHKTRREGDLFEVRLIGVRPALSAAFGGADSRVALTALKQDGNDTVVTLTLRQPDLAATPLVLAEPPRVAFTFRNQPATLQAPPPADAKPRESKAADQPVDPVAQLLRSEKSPLVRANYNQAERDFRVGDFEKAGLGFMRVYNADPESPLAIRAYFRAADAQYERLAARKATTFHGLIATYQSAIRAAETAGYDAELIPRAIFRIGRSYEKMGFDFEADIHYRILQDRFPGNQPYSVDSFFHQANALRNMRKFEPAIAAYRKFLERDGAPELLSAALYHLGDVLYSLEQYTAAKPEFDRARRLAPDYPKTRPVLWFHMGETYYATAQFDDARAIYNDLLERYPGKPYSKLVGLRLGDFLRQEGKEADALRMYRNVIEGAPLEISLRGKMRIADLLANRPVGTDFEQALKLFDEVVAAGEKRPIVAEAALRKALTLTLHHKNREAAQAFIELAQAYPKDRFVVHGIVRAHILENLKALVDGLFEAGEYWEVVKAYTERRQPYFDSFPFNVTLFQVARAYHFLGLFDQAQSLYARILRGKPGSLGTLVQYQSALASSEKDDLLRAEETLLRFIRANEKDVYLTDVRLELGRVYFEGRRYNDALNAFQILIEDFEKSRDPEIGEAMPEAFFLVGQIHKELGQLKESVEAFQAASKNFHHPLQGEAVPEFIVLSQFFTGDVLFDLGRDQDAVEAYEAAMARYPDHEKTPWARFQIGLILRRGGEERKALEIFNGLVELAKTRPGELWETLARENQRDLVNSLGYQDYLNQ